MQTYISILRGINVSGQRVIKMDDLRTLYAKLGFLNSQSYIQSGNVIFQNQPLPPKELERLISAKIADSFNFDVPVIVLDIEELNRVILNNPFPNEKEKDSTRMHVTFLSGKPEELQLEQLIGINFQPDEFHVIDKAIYVYCPNGYGATKLNNAFFERKLGLSATSRNWKTTLELRNMAEKLDKNYG
jgi:uncharacterized protein (DUF1697 family)